MRTRHIMLSYSDNNRSFVLDTVYNWVLPISVHVSTCQCGSVNILAKRCINEWPGMTPSVIPRLWMMDGSSFAHHVRLVLTKKYDLQVCIYTAATQIYGHGPQMLASAE